MLWYTQTTKSAAPYGTWESPITAAIAGSAGAKLSELCVNRDSGALLWLESRPLEGGRYVVRSLDVADEAAAPVDLTPGDVNVRTRVHEYGGASYCPASDGCFFADFQTQRLKRWRTRGDAGSGGVVEPIAPQAAEEATAADSNPPTIQTKPSPPPQQQQKQQLRFADMVVDAASGRMFCVCEDHSAGGREGGECPPAKVVNKIVGLSLDGSGCVRACVVVGVVAIGVVAIVSQREGGEGDR